jgi:hypothetical protein
MTPPVHAHHMSALVLDERELFKESGNDIFASTITCHASGRRLYFSDSEGRDYL